MVTNCKNCGLPIFHGIAGYAGPQCMCKLVTLPQMFDESMARIVALEAERDQLKVENEALMIQSMHRGEQLLTLRKQVDEARELLADAVEWNWLDEDAPSRESIDAWLEANK